MPSGKTLHRWTDHDGQEWACSEYDHGPMCRRCQRVDELLHELLDAIEEGDMECRQHPDTAQFEFKATGQGTAKAEALINSSAEAAALYAKAQQGQSNPKLSKVEQNVLKALHDAGGEASPAALVEATGYTRGQVEHALATLAEVGFIG